MNKLNKRYVIKLDIKNKTKNIIPSFSLSDNETSDLIIKVVNDNKTINLENTIPLLVAISPNNEFSCDLLEIESVREGLLYCKLSPNMKNVEGEWKLRLMLIEGVRRITTQTFNYQIDYDEFLHFNNEVEKDDRYPVLTEIITRLSTIELNEQDRINLVNNLLNETSIELINFKKETTKTLKDDVNKSLANYENIINELYQSFKDIISNVTIDSEVILARKGEKTLGDRLNKFDEQFNTKANKNEVRVNTDIKPINVSEMDTETKKLFTGGAVAVVGENAVGNENVKNKSITYQKTKGINYFNNINKTSNNFYEDIQTLKTTNTNLEIINGEVYFKGLPTKEWLFDNITDNDEISFILTNDYVWLKIAELDAFTYTLMGIGENRNGEVYDMVNYTPKLLQNRNIDLSGTIKIGDEVTIKRSGYEYSVYCNGVLSHNFSLLALKSLSTIHKFGLVCSYDQYNKVTTSKPLIKEITISRKNSMLNFINNKFNNIDNSVKKLINGSTKDKIYNGELFYDSYDVEFKYKEDNSTIIADLKNNEGTLAFYPCYFNKNGIIKFEFINQDTFIILSKSDNCYYAFGLGNKNNTENITGRLVKFESDNKFTYLKKTYLEPPKTGDYITISYINNIFELYYNDKLITREDFSIFDFGGGTTNFGVIKTPFNDVSNNGLIKNVSFESDSLKNYVEENSAKIKTLENSVFNYYKDTYANFLGDSITQGVGTTKQYHQFIKEQLGLKDVRNYGIGGTCITNIEGNNFISRHLSMDNNAELIVVFGGTNDFGHHMPLGDINSNDDKTFYGALKVLCKGLINKYPGKTIIFVTPLNRNCDLFPADGCPKGQKTNNLGLKLEDYVNAIKEVVPGYSIPVYDLFANSNLYPYCASIVSNFMPDGLHININGHEIVGRKIGKFINLQ